MYKPNDIVNIKFIRGLSVKNLHNNVVFPPRIYLEVNYRDGLRKYLDLVTQRDITSIDYYEMVKRDNYKEKTIFQEKEE